MKIVRIKMRYSIEPRDRIYVKGYGFLSFAKNMGRHANKVTKSLSNKYSQKIIDSAKKIYNWCHKNCFKKSNSKNSRSNWSLIGNKIADKITSVSKKKSTKELPNDETKEEDAEITTHKKRYISPEERQQIIDELRLVPRNYW